MSVSKEDAKRRLNYLRAQMLRAIFGNSWRRKGGKIVFLTFKQGSRATSNQHFHVLMAIEGEHNWSELRIARPREPWEKPAHVDWDWKRATLSWLTSRGKRARKRTVTRFFEKRLI
jgi:hypothetical protein